MPSVSQSFGLWQNVKQATTLGWRSFTGIIRELPFIGIVLAGVILLIANSASVGEMYGTSTYPVTYNLLQYTGGQFMLFILIIITFYSGEIVWRERRFNINQIMDVMPVPNWVYVGSKLLVMLLVVALMQCILMVVSILIQVGHGFYEFNIPLYLTQLFTIRLPFYFAIAVLAVFIQNFSRNIFVGHVGVLLFYLIVLVGFPMLGLEHRLFQFPKTPASTYSDMNGFGHFLTGVRWYQLAWFFVVVMLATITCLFWNRGANLSLANRFNRAKAQFKGSAKAIFVSALVGFLVVGGFIIYNTTVLNTYSNSKKLEKMMVRYESTYKRYQGIPQPKVRAVDINVDIYPDEHSLVINGIFTLKNETKTPIDSVHLVMGSSLQLTDCQIGKGSRISLSDTDLGYHVVALASPLMPGDTIEMSFCTSLISRGFADSYTDLTIMDNGAFLHSPSIVPNIGYQPSLELGDVDKRKKYNLPPKERMALRTDSVAWQNTYLGHIGDWVDFSATVSTKSGQIAIAPGPLERDWEENGRHYFHYRMDGPMLNFYSFLSANYEVATDKWNDVDLEIYYHKGHEYNVCKMPEAMKASLSYFTANFSPYQHRVLRIVEFPRYGTYAQSFPTTIPYSESIGFIANLENEEDIDYVYYVTAHEIAHQWWAHQVIGANVQGGTLMSEALAQYSALMVMQKRYGKEQMRKFLKHELDGYLGGRRRETQKELPLTLCENQNYIHYNKGSVVMYALQDYIGEENVNAALAEYVSDWGYKSAPFSTSEHFMEYIYRHTPDSLHYVVHDMFETITLYDIKAKEATMEALPDGKYRGTLTGEVQKFRADSLGNETPIPFNDWIDVAVMGTQQVDGKEKPTVLYMQKHRIGSTSPTFEIVVDEKPKTAGIDPYNKLIDRHSYDNSVEVK